MWAGRGLSMEAATHPQPGQRGSARLTPVRSQVLCGHKGHQAPVVPRDQVGGSEDGQEAA